MSQELETDTYDVVVLGTGLAESIAAASLAKVGKSVLHLDPNEYYASEQASLTLDELASWAKERSSSAADDLQPASSEAGPSDYARAQKRRYTRAMTSALTPDLERDKRRYAISLYPAVLPSRGSLISTLIASNVSKYVGFRLLDSVGLWQSPGSGDVVGEKGGSVQRVPGSKEEVFKDKSIGLADKRKLMKFLMWVAGEFEDDPLLQGKTEQPLLEFLQESFGLPVRLAEQITYAIAHASSPTEQALPALLRTRRYLKSIGRYGPGAFLVGQYGGAGEVAQGFCRACAVKGGTYVLGSQAVLQSLKIDEGEETPVELSIPCHGTPIRAKHIIASSDHLPPSALHQPQAEGISRTTAHLLAILPSIPATLRRKADGGGADSDAKEGEQQDTEQDDTAIVVFPPEGDHGVVRALMMGEGTGSCPSGQYILYLTGACAAETDPAAYLQRYLDRLHPSPLFTASYLSHLSEGPTSTHGSSMASENQNVVLLKPYAGEELLTEGLDWEAEQGEAAFWAVMGGKPAPDAAAAVEAGQGFFEKEEGEGEDEPDMDD